MSVALSMTPLLARSSSKAAEETQGAYSSRHSRLVIARLIGGLGNQLFQYAAARRISLRSGLPLKLDLGGFESYALRTYRLGAFRIAATRAASDEVLALRGPALGPVLERLPLPRRRTHVKERHFHFDSRILAIRGPAYLAGYWQSERYFADVAENIRAEITVDAAPAGDNAETLRAIESGESVCVHVRRGDYVTNKRAQRRHGACSLEYYGEAVAGIRERVERPHYFVFSDDPAWARANLSFDGPVRFVDHNGPDHDFEDLRLMSRCRHHIIANSTFSWWGAWLARRAGQVVIAPKRWFASGKHDARDVYPEAWLKL